MYFSNGGVSGAVRCRLRAQLTEIISNPHRTVRLEIGKSSFNFKAHEPPRATCGGRVTRSQMSTSIPLQAPKLYKNLAAWLLEQRKVDISIAALEKQQWRAESPGQGKFDSGCSRERGDWRDKKLNARRRGGICSGSLSKHREILAPWRNLGFVSLSNQGATSTHEWEETGTVPAPRYSYLEQCRCECWRMRKPRSK